MILQAGAGGCEVLDRRSAKSRPFGSFLDLHPMFCRLRSFSVTKIVDFILYSSLFWCRFLLGSWFYRTHCRLHVFSPGLNTRTTHFLSFCTLRARDGSLPICAKVCIIFRSPEWCQHSNKSKPMSCLARNINLVTKKAGKNECFNRIYVMKSWNLSKK